MAMIDYGAILVRDGKRMNKDMFMGKTDTGYTDDDFTQDMFVCVGNGNILIGAYKCIIVVEFNGQTYKFFCGYTFKNKKEKNQYNTDTYEYILNEYDDDIESEYVSENVIGCGITLNFERIDKSIGSEKFKVSFFYMGHDYQIYFGYGIDPSYKVFKRLTDDPKRPYGYTDREIAVLRPIYDLPYVG